MKICELKTIIVDDNKEFCGVLNDYFSAQKHISVTGIAHDGLEALKLIQEKKPDLVIMDLIMPRLDGLGVLENLSALPIDPMPKIVMMSAMGLDKITQAALSLGADYYVIKPFDMDMLAKRIKELFNVTDLNESIDEPVAELNTYESKTDKNTFSDLKVQITDMLHSLGFTANIKGYTYLREAIGMTINDINLLSSVKRKLYPLVAGKYYTTGDRVERAIRHAIGVTWSKGNSELLCQLLGSSVNNDKVRPTNLQLIAEITYKLRSKNKILY